MGKGSKLVGAGLVAIGAAALSGLYGLARICKIEVREMKHRNELIEGVRLYLRKAHGDDWSGYDAQVDLAQRGGIDTDLILHDLPLSLYDEKFWKNPSLEQALESYQAEYGPLKGM